MKIALMQYFEQRKAHVHCVKQLFKKGFTGFKLFYRRCRYTPNEERNLVRKYDAYYVFSQRKKVFNGWVTWLRDYHIPNQLNKEKAQGNISFRSRSPHIA